MANLFDIQEADTCFLSLADVRDSLGYTVADISDVDLTRILLDANASIRSYLHDINASWGCGCEDCEDVPIEIKRAVLLMIETLYNAQNATWTTVAGINTDSLAAGSVIEASSCDSSIKFHVGKECCGEWDSDLLSVPDSIRDMLSCFEVNSFSINICWPCCPKTCECNITCEYNINCE